MKKLIYIFLILFSSYQSFSQDSLSLKKLVVKISPQHFIANTFLIGVEGFNKNYSSSINFFGGITSGKEESGFSGEFQYRIYGSPMKLKEGSKKFPPYFRGIFLGFFLKGESYTLSDRDYNFQPIYVKRKVSAIFPGVVMGIQRTFEERIFVEFFVGGGIRMVDQEVGGSDIFQKDFKGVIPKIGINIGIGI
jgi:hypothetical protein